MHRASPRVLTVASTSDVGRVRSRNEDHFGEFTRSDGTHLLVVADGMGGHRAGATASRITVETVGEVFRATQGPPEETLRAALEAANTRVHDMAAATAEMRGMGTTAVLLLLSPDGPGFVAHVGDSRAYRYRDDALRPLTQDHSVVAELERRGLISAEEAAVHPRRNEIMRSVGVAPTIDVEVQAIDVKPGDRYLLCSDGLSGMVDETEIAVILEGSSPEHAARALVERANEHGGHDNVTVQVVAVDAARREAPGETTTVLPHAPARGVGDTPRAGRGLLWLAVALATLAVAIALLR